jgi:hypothetical protein
MGSDGKRRPLGVYLLAVYVIDDTDFWSDGEIYWWSIPTLLRRDGTATWSASYGLPAGAPPHKCGDLEWMTNIALREPPLLAVIPPDAEVAACVTRIAVYDDDGAVADFPKAMAAGYEALAECKPSGLPGAASIIGPVRDAIFKALRGEQDDIILEEDVTITREDALVSVGFVSSVMKAKGRAYYVVKDELRTVTVGPVSVRKGEAAVLKADMPVQAGGRVGIFARGASKRANVSVGIFGDLTTDKPFLGTILDAQTAAKLAAGISLTSTGEASVVLFYTPPDHA